MNTKNILRDVQQIFQDIFDNDSIVVTKETRFGDVEGWDSLSHIRFIIAIEKHFCVKFAFDELESMKNVGQLLELIESKAGNE